MLKVCSLKVILFTNNSLRKRGSLAEQSSVLVFKTRAKLTLQFNNSRSVFFKSPEILNARIKVNTLYPIRNAFPPTDPKTFPPSITRVCANPNRNCRVDEATTMTRCSKNVTIKIN